MNSATGSCNYSVKKSVILTVYESDSAMVTNLKNVKITYKCKQTVTKFQLI